VTARPGIALGNRRLKYWLLMGACLVQLFQPALYAQAVEFLPEINTYVKLDTNMRFAFHAKETRENGIPKQAEIGSITEFYWRPLKNLRPTALTKPRPVSSCSHLDTATCPPRRRLPPIAPCW
jgi:hypothetical protein